jgi:hypothetical protein
LSGHLRHSNTGYRFITGTTIRDGY